MWEELTIKEMEELTNTISECQTFDYVNYGF